MSDTITGIHVYAQTAYGGPKRTVEVNSNAPIKLTTDDFDVYVLVRIRDYANDKIHHIDHAEALKYFESEEHKNDTISVQFIVYFKKDVPGDKLLWGNDWDKPIRDILPWGFSAAFSFFKYAVDPGVDGDVYADKPWVYGPAITSINHLHELGADADPMTVKGPIKDPDASARCKKYLDETERKNFTYEKGHFYAFDFSNPYLDMSTTPKIKMPGFTFDVGKYAGLTDLRYVLKNGDDLVFALLFSATKDEGANAADEPTSTESKADASQPSAKQPKDEASTKEEEKQSKAPESKLENLKLDDSKADAAKKADATKPAELSTAESQPAAKDAPKDTPKPGQDSTRA